MEDLKGQFHAVVLISGGMDSAVVAGVLQSFQVRMSFLFADYGQNTLGKEEECFHRLAEHYKVDNRLIVDLTALGKMGGSILTATKEDDTVKQFDGKEIPVSYVPFRNGWLLAAATSWAEIIGANMIAIGAVEDDFMGYPDCRPSFYEAYEKVIEIGTRPETQVQIVAPLIGKTKPEIVAIGKKYKVPFDYTWSCYMSTEKPCEMCDSCKLRIAAFAEAENGDR